MRLIDADKIDGLGIELADTNVYVPIDKIWDLPTIDPETLPIVQQLRAELARVTAERDTAVTDMQALMWYSGDGCEICEHKIVEQRHPYTKLGCKLCGECNPKWCGVEGKND